MKKIAALAFLTVFSAQVAQGSHTKWSIVYDVTNKTIHLKTLDFPSVKQVAFSSFNFGCAAPSKA